MREADFVALFLKYKDLSARRKREFDRIFEMIDRELDHTKRADES